MVYGRFTIIGFENPPPTGEVAVTFKLFEKEGVQLILETAARTRYVPGFKVNVDDAEIAPPMSAQVEPAFDDDCH